jgi:hypothetical protein
MLANLFSNEDYLHFVGMKQTAATKQGVREVNKWN